jgi:hypothetical protein
MQIDSHKFDYNAMHRQEDMHALTNHLHTQKRELILVDKAQYLKKGHWQLFLVMVHHAHIYSMTRNPSKTGPLCVPIPVK